MRVNIFVAPTDLSYEQIDRGARSDVIFALAGAATDDAARNNIIHADAVRPALRNGLVLVGKDASGDAGLADLARLIAGKRLAIANPERDIAGADAVELLRKIGVMVDDNNKSVAVAESSAGVVSLLSSDKAQLGIVYASDATAGFSSNSSLPTPDQPAIEYIVAKVRDPAVDTDRFNPVRHRPRRRRRSGRPASRRSTNSAGRGR